MLLEYNLVEILSEESELSIDEIDALTPLEQLQLIREVVKENQEHIDYLKRLIYSHRLKIDALEQEVSESREDMALYQSDRRYLEAGLIELERRLLIRPCPGQLPLFEVAA